MGASLFSGGGQMPVPQGRHLFRDLGTVLSGGGTGGPGPMPWSSLPLSGCTLTTKPLAPNPDPHPPCAPVPAVRVPTARCRVLPTALSSAVPWGAQPREVRELHLPSAQPLMNG